MAPAMSHSLGVNPYAAFVLECLDMAVDGCQNSEFKAMVTGPVNKAVINAAGFSFTGHTEYLAARLGVDLAVMMLVAKGLRVALVTTHLPLAKVCNAISKARVMRVVKIVDEDLRTRLGVASPRIGVCGLNPHAGEEGNLGREEIEHIIPAMDELKDQGLDLIGPLPADTAFTPGILDQIDAMVTMYHDQGLPVLKHTGFGCAANVTLGLPIIRTSVDHGTAFELAGSGKADIGGLVTAIQIARDMIDIRYER